MASPDRSTELESLMDELSYQVTAVRTAGLSDPDQARNALKRARGLVADADALISSVVAERLKGEGSL